MLECDFNKVAKILGLTWLKKSNQKTSISILIKVNPFKLFPVTQPFLEQ